MMNSALRLAALSRLVRDRAGIAATEFALILPMMVTLFFAAVELNELMSANKRVENVASSIADVVSRSTSVSNGDVADLWSAGEILMFPSSTTPLKMRITRIDFNDDDEGVVVWSDANVTGDDESLSAFEGGDEPTLPAGAVGACSGATVIVAESQYSYAPPIGFFLKNGISLSHRAFMCPRVADDIQRVA